MSRSNNLTPSVSTSTPAGEVTPTEVSYFPFAASIHARRGRFPLRRPALLCAQPDAGESFHFSGRNSPGFGDFLCFVISEIRMSGVAVLRFRFSLPFAIRGRSLLGIIRIIGE